MTKVNLATTIVPDDHKIWKLFPGEGYKFDHAIDAHKIAFLDVRGLDRMSKSSLSWKRDRLEDVVSLDRWRRQVSATGNETERRVSGADKRTATYVEGLLNFAKKGDFLAVPSSGPTSSIAIYELSEAPGITTEVEVQDGRGVYSFVGRRVRWLGAVPKRKFRYEVIELLQTPVAFFDLGDSGRKVVYEEILGNFVYRGDFVAKYHVNKQEYNSRDNRIVSTWMEFVDLSSSPENFIEALSYAKSVSIAALLDSSNLSEEMRSDLSININSPGDIIMAAKRFAPLVGLVLFQLASMGVSYNDALAVEAQMTVLGGAVDGCTAQIDSSVRNIIQAMGADRWLDACELAQSAVKNAHLSTDASIE